MAWDFAVPEPWELLGKKVIHVGYATVAIDDAVFAVSVPMRPGDDDTIALRKVRDIVGSVQRLQYPFDPHRDVIDCDRRSRVFAAVQQAVAADGLAAETSV